ISEAEKFRDQRVSKRVVSAEQRHARQVVDSTVGSAADHELILFPRRAQQVEQKISHGAVWVIRVGLDTFAPAISKQPTGQVFLQELMHPARELMGDILRVRR